MFCSLTASAQGKKLYNYRFGASMSFGLQRIANNTVGIGAMVGAERKIGRIFATEAEVSYTYFTGDKLEYESGKNNAFALPAMAGIRAYVFPQVYVAARAGAIWFTLNNMTSSAIRPTYGLAGGINFPKKINRINLQGGYNWLKYAHVQRGYATIAACIIIN